MDEQTFQHLAQWIDHVVAESEQIETLANILYFLTDYPDLVGTRSWHDIRTLAERYKEM